MTAMMIEDGERVAADGAGLQWHMVPIADIELIARNTREEENGVAFRRDNSINISFSLGQVPPCSAVKQRRQTSETTAIANCVLAIMNDT